MRFDAHKPMLMLGATLLVLILVPLGATFGEQPSTLSEHSQTAPLLYLHAAQFAPSLDRDRFPLQALPSHDPSVAYLVQFEGPIQASWREELAQVAEIVSYIPDFAYRITLAPDQVKHLWDLPGVIWAGPFLPEYKLSPDLLAADDQIALIWLDEDAGQLQAHGLHILAQRDGYAVVRANAEQRLALASEPGVTWISPQRLAQLHNDVATSLIGAPQAWANNLQGSGQLVTVADTGIDSGIDYPQVIGDMHPDLDNRVAHIRSWPIDPSWYPALLNPLADDGPADRDYGHGTHVAASVAGNGARSAGQFKGVAPNAQLAFQALEQYCDWTSAYEGVGYVDGYALVGVPADLRDLYNQSYNWGSRIHSNSWGLTDAGLYTQEAAQTDRFVWEHPEMTILFSVGNEGCDADGDGRVDAGSISSPATAKNVLAVGGTESLRLDRYTTYGLWYDDCFAANPIRDDPIANAGLNGMLAISGRGPTRDGRIAPHVVAPGSWIASVRSSRATSTLGAWGLVQGRESDYMYLGGTSMSTPLVAGAVALVREAYQKRGHTPSAALLKATLIQSADDIPGQYAAPYAEAGPIPNLNEGWGAVNLAAATDMGRAWVDQQYSLGTGQTLTLNYDARQSPHPVKVTLVWSDYPGDPAATKALVNDLDLRLTAPDGTVYRGNVFQQGWSVAGGSSDRLNNVECVYLPASQQGTYQVNIQGYNVPQPVQRFALLVDLPEPMTPRVRLPLVLSQPSPTPTATATATSSITPTPSRTATPSRTPTPTGTPTMAPGEWREDFSVINSELWVIASTNEYVMDYHEGSYRIQVSPTRGQVGSLPAREQPGDFQLEITARAANTVPQAYGLLFNYQAQGDTRSYVAFVVSTDGQYAVLRRDGSYVVGWTPSLVVSTGQAINHILVRRVGQEIACEVNGTRLITMERAEFAGGAGFGLISVNRGNALTDARFDDLRMVPLAGTSSLQGRPSPKSD